MTEVLYKRHISEELGDESIDSASKRQETNKKLSKPGRKPIDTEPKNKRTAQNRAAQRAFRERKERKMKELEDKIASLEDEKKSANTEAEFLRVQVQMLMSELAKHRGTSDVSDLNLPQPQHRISDDSSKDTPSSDISSTFSGVDSESTVKSEMNSRNSQFSFEFPWSRKGSYNKNSPNIAHSTSSSNNIPGLASDASTASSAESSPFELYNTEDQSELPLFNQIKKKSFTNELRSNKDNIQEFNFNETFDEGINQFCNDLNSACGTREAPIPRSKSQVSTPLENMKTPGPRSASIQEDPLSFLTDGNLESQFGTFDPSLVFSNNADNEFDDLFNDAEKPEVDPIASLTTEESLYDPFGLFIQSKNSPIVETVSQTALNNDPAPSLSTLESTTSTKTKSPLEDLGLTMPEDEVVPAREGRLMKCTEIWDRITAHPKYSDIDIDGLCTELRSKAKCSDKGVVIDFADVNNVILNSLPSKRA